jgi:DNA-binding NtrC family response regulator
VGELVRRLELEVGGEGRGPVLVVDDDPNFLRTLAAVLAGKGFRTIEATGLEDALRRVQDAAPPVVLLDLRLNHGEPRDSVLAIREVNPLVTIILYSGHPALLNDTVESLPEPWIHGALHKPFSPEKLIGLLEGVLHG